jgi:hypothetical protein
MNTRRIDRKQFLLGLVAGSAALAIGCGDDEPAGDGAGGSAGSSGEGGNGSGAGPAGPSSSGNTGGSGPGSSSSAGGGGPGSGGGGGGGGGLCKAAITAMISANHGHALEIPIEDIEAGVTKTYSAQGTAMHCHEVEITAEDFATLQAGGVVKKFSCNGTDHEYVLSCAPGAPGPVAPDCAATPNAGSC